MSYKITDEQKKALLQYSAQTLPDNPSREGFSAESIRKRMYKPIEKLIDLVNSVFDTAYTDVKSIITAIKSGDLFARSVASWSASYTYGADEITFYPSISTYGAFVQSVVAGNTNNAPYVDGAINSAYWKEVVNFNTVTEDYFQQVQEAVAQAENAASEAEGSAQAAANSATTATEQAEAAAGSAGEAAQSATEAANYASAANASASQAAASATQSQNSANQSGTYASNAQTSAQNAADSATEAQVYAEQSRIYSERALQYNYEYSSVAELPVPGSTRYIYMIPKTSPDADDYYDEYAWSESNNDYSLIGTSKTSVDLSNYYTKSEVDGKISAETNAREQSDANLQQAVNAKYTKPSSGIPESDLAQAVKDKLNKESISQSDIISVETLPTATADSPDFVQTPDGKLYRKKVAADNSILAGSWVFDDTINYEGQIDVNFTSNGGQFIGFKGSTESGIGSGDQYYNLFTFAYLRSGTYSIDAYMYGTDLSNSNYYGWSSGQGEEYRIVTFAEGTVNSDALDFMQSNAVKQSVYSYEEVGASASRVVDLGSLREGANTISSELSQKVMDESCTIVKFELSNVVGQDIYCTRSIEVPTENGVAFTFTMTDDDNTIRTYGITVKGTTATLAILDINAGGTAVEFATVDECAEAFNPTLMTFQIMSVTYNAKINMTWRDWVSSDYNTAGFTISGSNVKFSDGKYVYDEAGMVSADAIIQDNNYSNNPAGAGSID